MNNKKGNYVTSFLNLKCAGDILNIISPVGYNIQNDICKAMAIVRQIKTRVLREPNKYTVYELCAKNALTGALIAFLLPVKEVIAIDKNPYKRNWGHIRNFSYIQKDIHGEIACCLESDAILVSANSNRHETDIICKMIGFETVKNVVVVVNKHLDVDSLQINTHQLPPIIKNRINDYLYWCYYLSSPPEVCHYGKLVRDNRLPLPKNCIVELYK